MTSSQVGTESNGPPRVETSRMLLHSHCWGKSGLCVTPPSRQGAQEAWTWVWPGPTCALSPCDPAVYPPAWL